MSAAPALPSRNYCTEYLRVVLNTIRINPLADELATRVLERVADCRWASLALRAVRDSVAGRVALVFGAGPSLERSLSRLKPLVERSRDRLCLIAANGATSALMTAGLVPDVITTDLDGDVRSIIEANLRGSTVLLHVHGDNLWRVLVSYRAFQGRVLLTTQVHERSCVYNVGGFTDGDRAVLLALRGGAEAVVLVGMDFGELVGRYSKPWLRGDVKAWPSKLKKFAIAKRLIEEAASAASARVLAFPENAGGLAHVGEVGYEDLVAMLRR